MSRSKSKELNSLGDAYGSILNKVKTVSEGVNTIGDAPLKDGGPQEKGGFKKTLVDKRSLTDKQKKLNLYNIDKLSEEDEEACMSGEDEETCKHAEKGCKCDECAQCKANQNKEEDEESLKESRKIISSSLNNFMRQKSVFDRLYANVMKESFGQPGAPAGNPYDEGEEGNDLDALGLDETMPDDELGEGGEGDVTITLDRATAEKLLDIIGAAMGEDEMPGEDDMGGEGEDDMGGEGEDEMGGFGEEDEEELGHAGVNAKYNDGKSNKVGSLKTAGGSATSKYTDKVGTNGDLGHAGVNAKYNDGKSNKVGALKTGKSAFEQ